MERIDGRRVEQAALTPDQGRALAHAGAIFAAAPDPDRRPFSMPTPTPATCW